MEKQAKVAHDMDNPKEITAVGKCPLWLFPRPVMTEVCRAFESGLKMPGRFPYNWRLYPIKASTYISASNRHEAAWLGGEELAEDTKVHHLAHDIATKSILLDALLGGTLIDDRPSQQYLKDTYGRSK